jgi:hypothetical protein
MSGKNLTIIPPTREEAYRRVFYPPAVADELRKQIRHIHKHLTAAEDAAYQLDRKRPAVARRFDAMRTLLFEISRSIRDL